MILAHNAELIIKNVGSDAPLKWRDKESGLIFTTSYCRLITALFNFSIQFIVDGYVSIQDFISSLDHDDLQIPDDISPDDLMNSGWSMECMSCSGWREGPVITIKVDEDDVIVKDNDVVFNFCFVHRYCDGFLNCDQCDRRLSGMLESDGAWACLRDAFEPQREFR